MGTSKWDSSDWSKYSSVTSTKSTSEIFTASKLDNDLDPKNINRESRDSDAHPESTAIIVAVDVTGSMGMLADNLIRSGLGTLFEEIIERKPVSNPHIMAMAVGDAEVGDRAPLQVTQFETDLTIATQLEQVYVEGGGGGNGYESYDLPLYFAAYHTSIDCIEKRNKKGYLFILGDEPAPSVSRKTIIKELIGDVVQSDIPMDTLIADAMKMYNVYYIMVKEGWYCKNYFPSVKESWTELLGQNAIPLDDYTKLAEVIVSIIEVNEGKSVDEVASSWSGDTSMVVTNAVKDLKSTDNSTSTGVVRL